MLATQPPQSAPNNPNFNPDNFNGPIPGEGLTRTPNGAAYHQPPQFVHLNDLLEYTWDKLNNPQYGLKIYGLVKAGMPVEAIARTILFAAFTHGTCTVTLAQLAITTVIRQIVSLCHFLGLKKMKIRNPDPDSVAELAKISKAIEGNLPDDKPTTPEPNTTPLNRNSIFTGLGA